MLGLDCGMEMVMFLEWTLKGEESLLWFVYGEVGNGSPGH